MFRKILIGFACVVALLVLAAALIVTEENWRGKRDWEKCKAELEAKGEHLDFAYYIPPQVPDDQNFVMTPFLKCLDYTFHPPPTAEVKPSNPTVAIAEALEKGLVHSGSVGWQMGMPRDLEVYKKFYDADQPDNPHPKSAAEDVMGYFEKYNNVFNELRQAAATRPKSRFPLIYDNGFYTGLPHYTVLQSVVHALSVRASAELELGRSDEALADIMLGLRLHESIRNEHFLISQLMSNTLIFILMEPIWEGVTLHRWSDVQLKELQGQLSRINSLADFKEVVRGERAAMAQEMDVTRSDYKKLPKQFWAEQYVWLIRCLQVLPALTYQNEVNYCNMVQDEVLPVVDEKRKSVDVSLAKRNLLFHVTPSDPYHVWFKPLRAMLYSVLWKTTMLQADVNLAIAACEIERYRLAHGTLPASLEDLHAELPRDVINDQPLHYKVTAPDNYLLYSVGWNEKDDGGTVVRRSKTSSSIDYEQGDWVWSLKPL